MNFTPATVHDLQHFVGKVCTVFLARRDQTVLTEVRKISGDGLWGQHPQNLTAIFIPTGQFSMIGEEVVLDPEVPEHARLIGDYEKAHRPAAPEKKKDEVTFVDIQQLNNLVRQTKQNYDNLGLQNVHK